MILLHYLYIYFKSWTTRAKGSMTMSVLISISLLSSLICLRLTDARPSTTTSLSSTASASPTHFFIPTHQVNKILTTNPVATVVVQQQLAADEQSLHSQTEEDQEAIEKMREGILTELGLSPDIVLQENRQEVNISRAEYVRAYTEYMGNVRRRRSLEKTQFYGARDRRQNAILRVQDFQDISSTNGSEEMEMVVGDGDGGVWREMEFDIRMDQLENFQPRIHRAILSLPTGCSFQEHSNESSAYSEVEVTTNVTSWLSKHDTPRFSFKSHCVGNSTGRSLLKIVTRHLPSDGGNLSRRKRATGNGNGEPSPTLIQKYQSKDNNGRTRDCDKTRHGKTCCRRSLRINFAELQIKDVVLEPKEFDAFMCVGRCNARRVPYATTHAMFQHTLHLTKGKKFVPRPCCTPTKLTPLDVIHTIPGSQMLQVTNLMNAIVQECGCS